MAYTFTEKKRIRKDFGKQTSVLDVPYLLAMQLNSYRNFLQSGSNAEKLEEIGLNAALKSVFPIVSYSGSAALEYGRYRLGTPGFDVKECPLRVRTYARSIRVKVRKVIYDKLPTAKKEVYNDVT